MSTVTRIDHGWRPVISPDGRHIAHGYELLHVLDPRTGASKPCPFAGTQYAAGWFDSEHVAFMSDYRVYTWDINTDAIEEQDAPTVPMASVWYAGGRQYFVDTSAQLWIDGALTLIGVAGLVANGPSFLYGAYPAYDRTIVYDSPAAAPREFTPMRAYAGPDEVRGATWVATAYQGADSEVIAPDGSSKMIAGEGRGPVVGIPSGETICFSVLWHAEKPAAMGRPWDTFTADAPGYWLPDIGHQDLTAMSCADGILIAGWKNDSTAEMDYTIIPFDEARVPIGGGAPVDPPIDPPNPPGGPVVTNEELMAKLVAMQAQIAEVNRLASAAEVEARAAKEAAGLAVARVTDAPVRMPYIGTGRLNPK